MAEELELSNYTTTDKVLGTDRNRSTTELTERRLLRIGILTLGVLCIIQATLNISLRLAMYSKEDVDAFPFNSSKIADLCQFEGSQQNSAQWCSCCSNLLRRLMREYEALKTERDHFQDMFHRLIAKIDGDDLEESGSGFME